MIWKACKIIRQFYCFRLKFSSFMQKIRLRLRLNIVRKLWHEIFTVLPKVLISRTIVFADEIFRWRWKIWQWTMPSSIDDENSQTTVYTFKVQITLGRDFMVQLFKFHASVVKTTIWTSILHAFMVETSNSCFHGRNFPWLHGGNKCIQKNRFSDVL